MVISVFFFVFHLQPRLKFLLNSIRAKAPGCNSRVGVEKALSNALDLQSTWETESMYIKNNKTEKKKKKKRKLDFTFFLFCYVSRILSCLSMKGNFPPLPLLFGFLRTA